MANIKTSFLRVSPTAKPKSVTIGAALRKAMRGDAFEMIVFDVGGGEAILLRRRKLAILVDGGAGQADEQEALGTALAGYIRSQNLKLAAIVASHPHMDHLNALSTLLRADPTVLKSTTKYFDNGLGMKPTLTDTLGRALGQRNPSLNIGLAGLPSKSKYFRLSSDVHITMMMDPSHELEGVQEYRSVFMVIRFRQARFLLTGDANGKYELAMINRLPADRQKHDVLKITHHGSHAGTTLPFVQLVKPRISVSSSTGDPKHNLSAGVRNRLKSFGSVFDTFSSAGDIRLRTDGEKRQLAGKQGILFEVEAVSPGRLKPHI